MKIRSVVLELLHAWSSRLHTLVIFRGCYRSTSTCCIHVFPLSPLPSETQSVAKRQTDGGSVNSPSDGVFPNPSNGPNFGFPPRDDFAAYSGDGASWGNPRSLISCFKENALRPNFPRAVTSYRTENFWFSQYPNNSATLGFPWSMTLNRTENTARFWGFPAREVFSAS